MRALVLLFPIFFVASCGQKASTGDYRPLRSADGTTWYSVECGKVFQRCLGTAAALCPQGYDTSPGQAKDEESTTFSMLVRCRATAVSAPPNPPPVASPNPPPAPPPAPAAPPAPTQPPLFRPFDK